MEVEYCVVNETPIAQVPVPTYTEEEHGTWALLLAKQEKLIQGRTCQDFIDGLKIIDFPKNHIPRLRDVSDRIEASTGWKLIRVDGLVRTPEFLDLLSRKIFPATDFIRKREELDYTSAPDMFHDVFGHTPLLTDKNFTEFFETFGHVGVKANNTFPEDHEIHKMLGRIYWYTVEFGLVQTPEGLRAYGSGSVSSPQEMEFCVSDKCRKHPFNIDVVASRDYDIWKLQEDVFVIPSFAQLGADFRAWSKKMGIAP